MHKGSQTPSNPEAAVRLSPQAEHEALRPKPPAAADISPFVCVSAALRRLLLQAEVTAPRLQFATIEGEAGTGKHLFAQTLHRYSALGNLPFRRCDAREWLAIEADTFERSGTLYLDRVDLLSPTGQRLLLNFIKMLPESPTRSFLLLLSTHSPLSQLAAEGALMPDLCFRLSAVRFTLPSLYEHREDIAPIAQALIDRICRRYQQPTAVLAQGTLPRLLQHSWPGNVRELASALEAAILSSTTGIIRAGDLILHPPSPATTTRLAFIPAQNIDDPAGAQSLTLSAVVQRHIQLVLQLNRGNKLRAARQLGISRSTLYRILGGESI